MYTGNVHLDDLFNNKVEFKAVVVDKVSVVISPIFPIIIMSRHQVNEQLADFGLHVYNANIEELRDMKGKITTR
jgi:hypothetical protein